MRSAALLAAALVLAACGPRNGGDAQEPAAGDTGDDASGVEPDPGDDEADPGDDGGDEAAEGGSGEGAGPGADATADGDPANDGDGEDGGAGEIVGSSSQTEVAPLQVKDYVVEFDVEFEMKPDGDGKQGVLEKIGEAGLPITTCYRELVIDDDTIQGEMEVAMKISAAGVAKPVKVQKNTTGNAGLEKCVKKNLAKQAYPKKMMGKKPVNLVVSLTFTPKMK